MARARSLPVWFAVHKWTSLICTAFMMVACITGLPLVFSEEINGWLHPPSNYAAVAPEARRADLDRLAATGRQMYPGQIVTSFFIDDVESQVYLWMAPSWAALKADPKVEHFIRFDARTAQVLEQSGPPGQGRWSFTGLMLSLHRDLFAGLPGELFLGMMAALFVIAILSGAVLYGPFMKKLDFGTVRRGRSMRLKWLDLHNLLGIVTLAWAFVVGATGVMNELSTPLFAIWKRTDVQGLLAPWRHQPVPVQGELSSAQAALDVAKRAAPGTTFVSIAYPGTEEGSSHHYLLWGHGNTSLSSRLFTPVLVDARTGDLTAVVRMPWYLRALEVSRPLHFGDYGGLPLKILWALMDVITIIVLGSGLYLWIARFALAKSSR
ncbi:PepSY-associated TM helix domain-containing protein [Achromobacter aloeverae]